MDTNQQRTEAPQESTRNGKENFFLAALIGEGIEGWSVETTAKEVNHTDSTNDFNQSLPRFLERIVRDNLLADEALLTELAAPFDDAYASKWSRWLPAKYRQRFLSNQVFDRTATLAWIRSVNGKANS